MKQEEKEILLNDSKGRLYTKTQCQCIWADVAKNGSAGVINELDTYILDELEMIGNPDCEYLFSDIKPYLRSMSSMTEEEKLKLVTLYLERDGRCRKNLKIKETELFLDNCWYVQITYNDENNKEVISTVYIGRCSYIEETDWLNKHHFDYRCLIKKGLALEAPEGMYNF